MQADNTRNFSLKRRLPHLGVFLVLAAAYLLGALTPLEHALMDLRFNLLKRPASGDVVIVQIDSRSLQQLEVWPWPRRFHAGLMERLFEAGAREVAFDIDFSSRSNSIDDRSLEKALERWAGRVVLPVFKQHEIVDGQGPRIAYTMPLPAFRRHARLAAVNVQPESDGLIRRNATVTRWRDTYVDGFSAHLAGRSADWPSIFYIDYGIRPETIPRLSYIDVLQGRFDRHLVAGKKVVVGGTAVELGDQHAVPVHMALSGPVLRALAFESLVQGRSLLRSAPLPILIVAFLLAWFLGPRFSDRSWRAGLVEAGAYSMAGVVLSIVVQAYVPLSLDTVPLVLVPLGSYLLAQLIKIDHQASSIFRHRMSELHRQAMMKCVVSDSFDGIVITDKGGTIELFNQAAAEMLGFETEEMIGRHIDSLIIPPRELNAVRDDVPDETSNTVRVDVIGPYETTVKCKDGTELVAELVISLSTLEIQKRSTERRELDRDVFIYTFRDMSERERTKEALMAKNQAELASRAKSEFLANMSHELRTPLNAIIGFAEVVLTEAYGPIGAQQYKDYINDIHGSGQHLLSVINDILDMSKIEAGEMNLAEEVIDFDEVAHSCLRLIGERAHKAGVRVSFERPPYLPLMMADKRMIKQILLNLLSNAVKFTPEGGRVLIRSVVQRDGSVTISVIDSGIGIETADLSKVIIPFGQVDGSLQRQYEGTGLGLPLVKSMIELHGGTLELESQIGRGTTATVRVPANRVIDTENVTQLSRHEVAEAV